MSTHRRDRRHRPAHHSFVASSSSHSGVPTVRSDRHLLAGCMLTIAVLALYGNSLRGPFILDDHFSITLNNSIREWWRAGRLLFSELDTPVTGRPLVNVSLAINYAISGLDVWSYHLWNVAMHLGCTMLVFGLVRRTLTLPTIRSGLGDHSLQLAFATALIWAVHPLNSEVVDYVTQRTESMMAFFCLLTLFASVRALESPRAGQWQTMAVIACALGMMCKETMVVTPLLLGLYDRTYVFRSTAEAFRSRWRLYGGLMFTWMVLAVVTWRGARGGAAGFSNDFGVQPWTYLLNQSVIITQYVHQVVWPRALVIIYGWPLPLTLGDVVPYVSFIGLLLLLTAIALVRAPKIGFLAATVFITLAPTSSIVPIVTEVGAERRMYLPLVPVVMLAVLGAFSLWSLVQRWWPATALASARVSRVVGVVVLASVSLTLAARTFIRNGEYASSVGLLQTVVEEWPSNLSHLILGEDLAKVGAHEEAMAQYRRVLAGAPRAYYLLGMELLDAGQFEEGIATLETLIDIWRTPPTSHPPWQVPLREDAVAARRRIGQTRARQQRWSEAAEQFQLLLTISPSDADARRQLGDVLLAGQSFDDAIAHYRTYLGAKPNDASALSNMAIALVAVSKPDEAIQMLRRAVDVAPSNVSIRRNLANALFDQRHITEAIDAAEGAVRLAPNDAAAREVLGRALAVQGKFDEAIAAFEQSLRLDPTYAASREDLEKMRRLTK